MDFEKLADIIEAEAENPIISIQRILTYTGPRSWALRQELDADIKGTYSPLGYKIAIESNWLNEDAVAVILTPDMIADLKKISAYFEPAGNVLNKILEQVAR